MNEENLRTSVSILEYIKLKEQAEMLIKALEWYSAFELKYHWKSKEESSWNYCETGNPAKDALKKYNEFKEDSLK